MSDPPDSSRSNPSTASTGVDPFLRAVARAPAKTPHRGIELVGARIAHFRIVAVLGCGGMGVVYEAVDERLGRKVALKMLLARETDDLARARFLREARAASVVEHPCVATVYEVGEADQGTYIAMELVRGETMHAWLRAPRSLGERVRVVREIARALARAHAMGIVHRDLKPDNVMISDDGRVKVLDFGLAKAYGDAGGPPDEPKSAEGLVVGTPGYMSPEQVKGLPVDARSDVFSFGVVLYETFTGERPFRGETPVALLIAIDRDEPARPRERAPEVPAALEGIILRCLAKRPEDRYADGAAIAGALEARDVAGGQSTRARARMWTWGAIALGAAGAIAAWRLAPARRDAVVVTKAPSPPPSTALADAQARGKALTDFPPYGSTNPAALEAYERGLRAQRALLGSPCAPFQEAIALDPAFAPAHVRVAVCVAALLGTPAAARASFREASLRRDLLRERDRALLDAWEPTLARQPADPHETRARSSALVDRYPDDAELVMYAAIAHAESDVAGAIPLYRRELALDPDSMHAVFMLGETEDYLGHPDAARPLIDQCLARSPGAFVCLWHRMDEDVDRGACADFESDARRAVASSPELTEARVSLANALVDSGRPLDAARAVVDQAFADAGAGGVGGDFLRVDLDLVAGDFDRALQRLRDLAPRVERTSSETEHAQLATRQVMTFHELGRDADAARIARDFLARRDAWESDPRAEDLAIESDATPAMIAALRRTGALSAEGASAARIARVRFWRERVRAPLMLRFLWLVHFAAPARTPDEAREALAALADLGEPPPFTPRYAGSAHLGRTLLLAGRIDDAIPALERATRACDSMAFPILKNESFYFLGQAREAKHDLPGACDAYGRLLARWSHATPRSVTLERARARHRALGCTVEDRPVP